MEEEEDGEGRRKEKHVPTIIIFKRRQILCKGMCNNAGCFRDPAYYPQTDRVINSTKLSPLLLLLVVLVPKEDNWTV